MNQNQVEQIHKLANDAARAGNTKEAVQYYSRLLDIQPRNVNYWLELEQLLIDQNKKRSCLEYVLKLEPGNPVALGRLQAMNTPAQPVPPASRPAINFCGYCGQKLTPGVQHLAGCPNGQPQPAAYAVQPAYQPATYPPAPQPGPRAGYTQAPVARPAIPYPYAVTGAQRSSVMGAAWKYFWALFGLTLVLGIIVYILYALSASDLAVIVNFLGTMLCCFIIPASFRRDRFTREDVRAGGVLAIFVSMVGGYFILPLAMTTLAGQQLQIQFDVIQGVFLTVLSIAAMLAGVAVYLKEEPSQVPQVQAPVYPPFDHFQPTAPKSSSPAPTVQHAPQRNPARKKPISAGRIILIILAWGIGSFLGLLVLGLLS